MGFVLDQSLHHDDGSASRPGQRGKGIPTGVRTMNSEGQDPPQHSLFDLKHTLATTLLAKHGPMTYVAAHTGHSTAATTLRHYARWLPKEGRRYVDLLPGFSPETLRGRRQLVRQDPDVRPEGGCRSDLAPILSRRAAPLRRRAFSADPMVTRKWAS